VSGRALSRCPSRLARRALVALLVALGAGALGPGETHAGIACGQTITQDTKLHHDLENCPGIGVVIGAPGITLDLNGHRIDGVGESNSGVLNSAGHDNVVVKGGGGGLITGFGRGIEMNLAAGAVIRGIGFRNNDSTFSSIGIFLNSSTDARVESNEIGEMDRDDSVGVLLQGGDGARVIGNEIGPISGAGTAGIRATLQAVGARVQGNLVRGAGERGIEIAGADETLVKRNRVRRAEFAGIWIEGDADETRVRRNTLLRNEDGVLVLSGTTGNTLIVGNVARRSKEDGIEVDVPFASLGDNLAVKNADWGIEADPGVTDLGGNRAAGNGHKCLNVVCTAP
jgi:large repetitive protein